MRKIRLTFLVITPVLILGLFLGCNKNAFSEVASTDSDEALLVEAEKLINEEQYEAAILKILEMSSGARAKTSTKRVYAAALAGDCGLNFINFFTAMTDATNSSGGLFTLFMKGFQGVNAKASSCTASMAVMRDIAGSDMIGDTADDQLFFTILGMATMGAVLAEKADLDSTDNLGDGLVDSTFNICTTGGASDVSDANMKELVASFGSILLNIGGLVGGDDVVSSVSELTATCDELKAQPTDPNPCAVTDPAIIGSEEIIVLRKMLHAEGFKPSEVCDDSTAEDLALTCCSNLNPVP